MFNIPRWQLRQEHEEDMKGILEKLGFTDRQGRIRKWDGKKFHQLADECGHSSLGFEQCSCVQ